MSEANLILDGRYEVIRQVSGGLGSRKVEVGRRGHCRFCGRSSEAPFRRTAHTFPEALGNKWIFSLDECDDCNAKFSAYEGALANSIAPLLTFSGVKGKHDKIRQTGRTNGTSTLRRDRKSISMLVNHHEIGRFVGVNRLTGLLRLEAPVARVPFRPRHAYKALCKMALAILPEAELCYYEKLLDWLQNPNDILDFPVLDVGLSLGGQIDKALPFVAGTLLRRTSSSDLVPHILFVLSAGPVCLQIDLMSDHLEDHLPPTPTGAVNIRWTNVFTDEAGDPSFSIRFGLPVHLNWSSCETQSQPLRTTVLDVYPRTGEVSITLCLRDYVKP